MGSQNAWMADIIPGTVPILDSPVAFRIKRQEKNPRQFDCVYQNRYIGNEGDGSVKRKNIGSTFDSWLREEGLYEKVSATAIKRVIARQVAAAMQQKGLTKLEMARRMRTSRAALDRLLDPENDAVTLSTIQKAAAAVGRQIRLELV